MIKLAFRLAVYGSAIAAGLGVISSGWLVGTFVSAYFLTIIDESGNAHDGDFMKLSEMEFLAIDNNIKKKLGIRLMYAGSLYIICLLLGYFVL